MQVGDIGRAQAIAQIARIHADKGAAGVIAAAGLAHIDAEVSRGIQLEKVSMAPPSMLVDATPSEPAPDDKVVRATFSDGQGARTATGRYSCHIAGRPAARRPW